MASRRQSSSTLVENIKTIVYAAVIALLIRTFLVEPFFIPSGSMVPTMLVGDYIFVTKYSYGFSHYSFPFGLPDFAGRLLGRVPHRGDVVVFVPPGAPNEDYIKRLVGLPGDTIQVTDGQLYINGKEVPRTDAGTYVDTSDGAPVVTKEFEETLPGGRTHPILKQTATGPMNNTGIYTVPPGHLFMMGDNRDDSEDSRYLDGPVGYVPMENVLGPAGIIFFSIDLRDPWWEFWEWPFEIRWNRLFSVVH